MRPIAAATARPAHAADSAPGSKDAKLRRSAQQLEGAFVQQMYKTMRSTVPTDGMFGGGSGEDMFTSLMDEHVASDTPLQWHHGLSEAIYRQLSGALHRQHPGADSATAETAAAAGLARTTTD